MKTTLDAHRLLRGTTGANGFKSELQVNPQTDQDLRHARRVLRTALREGMHQWQTVVSREVMFPTLPAPVATRRNMSPKFRTQGSYVYGTVNEPAHLSQQVDLDDGMFLPVSFVSADGRSQPSVAAKGYFQAVELILRPVCEKNGWRLKTKDTCVRVVISARAHIDIPLYSIPDDEFVQLRESVSLASAMTMDAQVDEMELSRDIYRGLSHDKIMLANRDGTWTTSDPRKLEDWWDDAVETYTDQLTIICRYLKAWRDFVWEEGGLPSIALMACAVKILEKLDVEISSKRDDVAFLLIAEKMPQVLNETIPNPAVKDAKALDHGWKPEQRAQYIEKARQLHHHLKTAICGNTSKVACINSFRIALGPRVPEDMMLVNPTAAEAEVLQYSQTAVAAPAVLPRVSG